MTTIQTRVDRLEKKHGTTSNDEMVRKQQQALFATKYFLIQPYRERGFVFKLDSASSLNNYIGALSEFWEKEGLDDVLPLSEAIERVEENYIEEGIHGS